MGEFAQMLRENAQAHSLTLPPQTKTHAISILTAIGRSRAFPTAPLQAPLRGRNSPEAQNLPMNDVTQGKD